MTLTTIFSIIIIHFLGDFVLQTDKQAKGKSKNWLDLLEHTGTYVSVFVLPICLLLGKTNPYGTCEWYVLNTLAFAIITFMFHTVTDYFTSRLNSKLWQEGKTHEFFVSIGFDQILHYVQLFTTYYLLTKI